MGLWSSVTGYIEFELVSADIAAFLSELQLHNIPLSKVQTKDALTVHFSVPQSYKKHIIRLAEKRGVTHSVIGRGGIYWTVCSLLSRPVLIAGLIILLFLTVFLPMKILFFRVDGNCKISSRQIIACASQAGLEFGINRRDVRSEKVKNALLKAIPELEWVGINTAGCVATISVRERQQTTVPQSESISSIVASRDGVIQEMIVIAGTPSVKPGQNVTAGQILISGYTNCGLSIRAQRAKGEVYAITQYDLTLVLPAESAVSCDLSESASKISLIFGKNRINFSQNSGILDSRCVKMYEEKYVTLPGGFILPLGIATERWFRYTTTDESTPIDEPLKQAAQRYLNSQMIAGCIISREEEITLEDGIWVLSGRYVCLEMIGREQSEEIITP